LTGRDEKQTVATMRDRPDRKGGAATSIRCWPRDFHLDLP